jgi:hypothetical protein
MWLCYGYLRDVVMLWVFKGCGYVMGIQGMWLCYGYLRDVVMLWVFKGCGYVMGI